MWQFISNFGGILGILGVSANSLMGGAHEAHIAFVAILVTCFIVLAYVFWRVRRWQQTIFPKGYRPISTFVRYSTIDGKLITYETFRHIQIKHTFLGEIEHRYRWSGTREAKLSSLLQTVGEARADLASGFMVRTVKFERPKFYNDTEVIHLRSDLDDSDLQSEPYVSLLIESPITVVQFRVELLHCTSTKHGSMRATVERRLKTITGDNYDRLDDVVFNVTSRSFDFLLKYPEPGYEYRLRWERPNLPQSRKKNNGATP